jgi:SAM-dependent methyltransferase
MFTKSAAFYDAIYETQGKNYAEEAQRVIMFIEQHKQSAAHNLLDAACGTGGHIPFLQTHYAVEGLDVDAGMLAIARQRCPLVTFHQADMVDFQLDRRFGAIICLFSSIGYVKTVARLQQTLQTMADHLEPGGVVLIEPWLTPDQYHPNTPHATFVNQPELKIARMNVSQVEDSLSVMEFHYLVATPEGVNHFTERHELGLFTPEDYVTAFEAAGLKVIFDREGLIGRGLYIGLQKG